MRLHALERMLAATSLMAGSGNGRGIDRTERRLTWLTRSLVYEQSPGKSWSRVFLTAVFRMTAAHGALFLESRISPRSPWTECSASDSLYRETIGKSGVLRTDYHLAHTSILLLNRTVSVVWHQTMWQRPIGALYQRAHARPPPGVPHPRARLTTTNDDDDNDDDDHDHDHEIARRPGLDDQRKRRARGASCLIFCQQNRDRDVTPPPTLHPPPVFTWREDRQISRGTRLSHAVPSPHRAAVTFHVLLSFRTIIRVTTTELSEDDSVIGMIIIDFIDTREKIDTCH